LHDRPKVLCTIRSYVIDRSTAVLYRISRIADPVNGASILAELVG